MMLPNSAPYPDCMALLMASAYRLWVSAPKRETIHTCPRTSYHKQKTTHTTTGIPYRKKIPCHNNKPFHSSDPYHVKQPYHNRKLYHNSQPCRILLYVADYCSTAQHQFPRLHVVFARMPSTTRSVVRRLKFPWGMYKCRSAIGGRGDVASSVQRAISEQRSAVDSLRRQLNQRLTR